MFLFFLCIVSFAIFSWFSEDFPLVTLLIYSYKSFPFLLYNDTTLADADYINETKIILFWTPFFYQPQSLDWLKYCPDLNCYLTNDRSYLSQSSAVIFHMRDFSWFDIPDKRKRQQRYVFQLYESPLYTWKNLYKMPGFFNWTMTYRLDSDVPSFYTRWLAMRNLPANFRNLNKTEIIGKNKRLLIWMVSNCAVQSKREKYVEILQKYLDIDIYGPCKFSKYTCSKNDQERCTRMIGEKYKFYLAFENSVCKDYITEKFYGRAHLNSVPVVLSRKVAQGILPENSFIAADDFRNPKELADFLLKLDKNDEIYLSYFTWRTKYGFKWNNQKNLRNEDFCLMCQKLNAIPPEPVKIYTNIHLWWSEKKCDINLVDNQLSV